MAQVLPGGNAAGAASIVVTVPDGVQGGQDMNVVNKLNVMFFKNEWCNGYPLIRNSLRTRLQLDFSVFYPIAMDHVN